MILLTKKTIVAIALSVWIPTPMANRGKCGIGAFFARDGPMSSVLCHAAHTFVITVTVTAQNFIIDFELLNAIRQYMLKHM